ncbi:MAG TPA: FkbM family methyltransferase [Solirubrobacteraceae bacterium]|nr:FkbM family methyltransferase [Solirubrobacteraceae bacterium]
MRRGAARAGLEAPLRAMWEHFNPAVRRDRIDNEHIRLLLSFALREDANCIDIGAHSGVILREMLRVAPRGHHIAYEPLPQLASQLTAEFPSVEVRNAAVSNENGEATFFQMVGAEMQSALKLRTGTAAEASRTFTVRVDKLDDALPADYVPALIKIDVEGAERQVLEGAMETLRRHAPIVAFEHGPGAEREYDTSPGQVYDLLVEGAGMRIFDIDGAGPYSRTQFVEIFPEPIWNFVAHR